MQQITLCNYVEMARNLLGFRRYSLMSYSSTQWNDQVRTLQTTTKLRSADVLAYPVQSVLNMSLDNVVELTHSG